MAGQTLESPALAPAVAPAEEKESPTTVQTAGNAAAQGGVPPGDGGTAGLANYQSALGEFLGKELYRAVSGALTFEAVSAYVNDAVDGAIESAMGSIGDIDGVTADPAALDALAKLLEDKLGPSIDKFLDGPGKELQTKLAGWVNAHPRTIVLVALLAAAGAVLANAPIPTLKKKFKIGAGTDAEIEAKVGRLRSISLERVRGRISHVSGPLVGALEVTHENGQTSGEASLDVGAQGKSLLLNGQMGGKGFELFGFDGILNDGERGGSLRVSKPADGSAVGSVSIRRADGSVTRTDDFNYDAGTGVFSLGRSALWTDGELSVGQGIRTRSDGSSEAGVGVMAERNGVTAAAGLTHSTTAYGMSETDKLNLGLALKRDDLTARLDAAFSSSGSQSITGRVERDLGGNRRAGADASVTFGNDQMLEVGAFYGFRDPKEFKTFLLDYRYKSQVGEHQFGLMVERELSGTFVRWQQSMTTGVTGERMSVTGQAARFVDDDTALIGGLRYDKDFASGRDSFQPQVGLQYRGIPVVVGYDTGTRGVSITITLPFGR